MSVNFFLKFQELVSFTESPCKECFDACDFFFANAVKKVGVVFCSVPPFTFKFAKILDTGIYLFENSNLTLINHKNFDYRIFSLNYKRNFLSVHSSLPPISA